MKRGIAPVTTLLAWTGLAAAAQPNAPVHRAPFVELVRYGGTWGEAASIPTFVEYLCAGDSTAQSPPVAERSRDVTNRCRTDSGVENTLCRAMVVAGTGAVRLQGSFVWPIRADYWVIGLDRNFQWAVVGNPNQKYVWIMSRTSQLTPGLIEAARWSVQANDFEVARLRDTPHGESGD